ncbi:MAG: FAD-dependent oxidoreductase [Planctomycetota bacterium]
MILADPVPRTCLTISRSARSLWLWALCSFVGIACLGCRGASKVDDRPRTDVIIYGATSAGITAAIQVAALGRSVVLLEPSDHLGGLTTGGLGATDVGRSEAIGGLAREFYRRVHRHYQRPEAWRQETREEFLEGPARGTVLDDVQYSFEPHVAMQIYRDWLEEHDIRPRLGATLARVEKDGPRLTAIVLESGERLTGRVFIDASYEGDLMAAAGVSYAVGREPNAQYGETLNGIQKEGAVKHQFVRGVDPFRVAGDPASGLLPGLEAAPPEPEGGGDAGVQAYCFRMCTTDVPENRVPWPKPEGYDPLDYELLLRNFEAGDERVPWSPRRMPNRKTDTNNNFAISTDYIGQSFAYPDASPSERERIVQEHLRYQMGLLWTLANDPRVPESVRSHFQTWGLARDEFEATNHWSPQIYVREARRLIGEMVMTEANCLSQVTITDSVALGAYNMDSHHVHRYVSADGFVRNEGDIQVGLPSPYGISYRALTPRREEAENLLVPVCVSASHIAFGSIRMEPVFMELGQAAGVAAVLAIRESAPVQKVPIAVLQSVLEDAGARLEPPIRGVKPDSLEGVVVDDDAATLNGDWEVSMSTDGFIGRGYRHDGGSPEPKQATFTVIAPESGTFDLRLSYPPHGNRASRVAVTIRSGDQVWTRHVDQKLEPPIDGLFVELLKEMTLDAGARIEVTVSNADADGYVVIDAVQLAPHR